jgi:hypothetical protein
MSFSEWIVLYVSHSCIAPAASGCCSTNRVNSSDCSPGPGKYRSRASRLSISWSTRYFPPRAPRSPLRRWVFHPGSLSVGARGSRLSASPAGSATVLDLVASLARTRRRRCRHRIGFCEPIPIAERGCRREGAFLREVLRAARRRACPRPSTRAGPSSSRPGARGSRRRSGWR